MQGHAQFTISENWARRFFTIWTGQAFSLFGSALVQFALVWYLTQETGSATVLATATLVALLPQVLLGPFAGTLVDRVSRRKVMLIADSSIALATFILAYLFFIGKEEIWQIYLIMMIRSCGGAFHWPAMLSSTSLMVPEKQLSRIAGLNQTLNGLVMIFAPPAGAVLIGLMPTHGVLFIDIGTAVLAILPLLFFSIPRPVRQTRQEGTNQESSFWQDMRDGLTYVTGWPGLLAILIMAVTINFLLNPTASLMPLLVTKHFGRGAIELGSLGSLEGIGMITGGALLGVWGGFRKRILTSLSGIVGIGIGVLMLGFAPASMFWLAIAGFFILGFMSPIANGPLMALIQASVRPDMQGRVMSLIGSAATAMSPLGLLIAGPVSDWLGIRVWYWVGGAVCLLMGLGAFFVPAIINVESNHRDHQPEAAPVPLMK